MHATQRHDPDLVTAHTTAAASSIARWVEQHHGLAVQQCHLIRRGLNDNYALRSVDGSRYVVRLYSIRPRGDFNADFELSLLAHLDAHGVAVAVPVSTAQGRTHVELRFPEGLRAMALFRHAPGAVPDTLEDFEQTGGTLARIHMTARDYAGPPSRYTLNGSHLAEQTLAYLHTHPELDRARSLGPHVLYKNEQTARFEYPLYFTHAAFNIGSAEKQCSNHCIKLPFCKRHFFNIARIKRKILSGPPLKRR